MSLEHLTMLERKYTKNHGTCQKYTKNSLEELSLAKYGTIRVLK